MFSNYKRINSNKYNKQNWIWEKKAKRSLVPVGNTKGAAGLSNQYQWKPKAPVEKTRCLKARPLVVVAGHRLGNRCLWPFSAGAQGPFSSSVWSILKDWVYRARMFVVNRRDNAGIMLDRIVKQEVEGRGWGNSLMLQVVDITEHLEGGVMEELVEEAVLDFAVCSQR